MVTPLVFITFDNPLLFQTKIIIMYFTKKSLKGLFTLFFITLFGAGVMAQVPMQAPAAPPVEDYTDTQLKQFAHAVQKVLNIQEESQGQMMASIEENDLSVDRFNEMLMQGQQEGQDAIDATEEEILAFTNAMNAVQQLQQQMQMDMMQAITDEGLNVEQYQGIMQAYETNPEVREKIDTYFSEME
ncbi:MAG: DUF4168 domain-containing protein [Bacteroidetes bacterium]|nr:MAG: DUF4168 domain-containing protein [Bacteroidota bacterium]